MYYEVIDNFLPKEDFEYLQGLLHQQVPWYFQKEINALHNAKDEEDKTFYMTHMLLNIHDDPQKHGIYSTFYKNFKFILEKLDAKATMRMKLNLYPRTDTIEIHKAHIDYNFSHKGCIVSFNTCNGATILEDGTKIDSVANRALLFEPHKYHSSTSCTNAKARLNLNINYF